MLSQGPVLCKDELICISYSMKNMCAHFFVFWSVAINGMKLFFFLFFLR